MMNSSEAAAHTHPIPARPWVDTYGNHLCGISIALGLPVEEASLCVASILTNMTGPNSGLDTRGGLGISRGINLVALGSADHRIQRLADLLFAPVYALQDFMRHAAQRSSRSLGDIYRFGPEKVKEWPSLLKERTEHFHEQYLEMLNAMGKDLKAGDTLPVGWDSPHNPLPDWDGKNPEMTMRQRAPGLRQLPSFVLCPQDVAELPAMMADVSDQHAFVVNIGGRLLAGGLGMNNRDRVNSLIYLTQLMAGKDAPVPRVYSDQGHGKLTRGRIALFSLMAPEDAAGFLGDESRPCGCELIEESILWTPSWRCSKTLPDGFAPSMWSFYKGVLERVVNGRASLKGTILSSGPSGPREIEVLDVEITAALDAESPAVHRYLRPFTSLPAKLFWAFRLLGLEATAAAATKATVLYAMRSHVSLIQTALSQMEVQRAERLAKQIKEVLRRKGPCTTRELQRSIFQSRRSDIDTGLERLLDSGQIVFAQSKREYHIPGVANTGEPPIPTRGTSPLTATAHG